MPLAALLKPCVFGGRLPRAVIRALPSGWGFSTTSGKEFGQDAAAAYVWYRTAAEAGVVAAEFNIAVMCDSGVGTARNAAEAAVWCASAAAHGARAEYNLAQLYEAGDGVPRNLDVAKAWYAAAAAHGTLRSVE